MQDENEMRGENSSAHVVITACVSTQKSEVHVAMFYGMIKSFPLK